nr:hypothetical protein [Kibdelosporangium sp. MJ126-NF4]CEL20882.1 hypothetical protein [Kibdelosporangium sp. MJ126-NF4]CTQ98313.1 hypothetical protein [Kibdelosporangium sp. MJ126-NF4]
MNSSIPWWATALIGIVGTLLGGLIPLSLGLLNRSSERKRLARAEKLEYYPALTRTANSLTQLKVWPAEPGDLHERRAAVEAAAENVAFIAPASVTLTAIHVLDTAEKLANTIETIRRETRPGHDDKVDQRFIDHLTADIADLRTAVRTFGTASRKDIEIKTPYLHLRENDPTERTHNPASASGQRSS